MPVHAESHQIARIGWLRAAVLGANDGIVSTASLILGVAASGADRQALLVAGAAGLVAGAMSMAAGEYVSVSSQSDTEAADLARERAELADDPEFERAELAAIYVGRGVDPATADRVAVQMMAHDALGSHARDELHINDLTAARPLQAALASALTFTVGAALPLLLAALLPMGAMVVGEAAGSILFRVVFWGALAMALTAGIGRMVGAAV
ncbi:VIT1/CCC1 transporter family protein [Sphingomonas sp. CCH18-B1]|uniref:VIT1/CCC1 transporter family protein n=1 Tax=Sphingomonas sp. CCH18-B1 TaxID=1768744 RepID=UPI00082B03DC|nr:VIT family protein [Sphingomonas sp. CCH18-B1]